MLRLLLRGPPGHATGRPARRVELARQLARRSMSPLEQSGAPRAGAPARERSWGRDATTPSTPRKSACRTQSSRASSSSSLRAWSVRRASSRARPRMTKLDFEAELAVVIGRIASNVRAGAGARVRRRLHRVERPERARVPVRRVAAADELRQEHGRVLSRWVRGWSRRTRSPTRRRSRSPVDVNGEPMQRGRTSEMIFPGGSVDRVHQPVRDARTRATSSRRAPRLAWVPSASLRYGLRRATGSASRSRGSECSSIRSAELRAAEDGWRVSALI